MLQLPQILEVRERNKNQIYHCQILRLHFLTDLHRLVPAESYPGLKLLLEMHHNPTVPLEVTKIHPLETNQPSISQNNSQPPSTQSNVTPNISLIPRGNSDESRDIEQKVVSNSTLELTNHLPIKTQIMKKLTKNQIVSNMKANGTDGEVIVDSNIMHKLLPLIHHERG